MAVGSVRTGQTPDCGHPRSWVVNVQTRHIDRADCPDCRTQNDRGPAVPVLGVTDEPA
jgi:hypothetical protein